MRKLSAALLLIILLLFCSSAAAEDTDALQYEKELIDIVEQITGAHVLIPDTVPEEIVSVYYDVKPFILSSDPEEAAAQRGKLRMDLSGIYAVWDRLPSGFLESFGGNLYVCFVDDINLVEYSRNVQGYCCIRSVPEIYLVLDYDSFQPWYMCHECWHGFEVRNGLAFDDWDSLNPEGFQYTLAYDNTDGFDPEWFYRNYGVVDPMEDRATVFEAYYRESEEWWEEHPHIKEKLDVMMQEMNRVSDRIAVNADD